MARGASVISRVTEVVATMAAPAPCTKRCAHTDATLGARARLAHMVKNRAKPPKNTRRWPSLAISCAATTLNMVSEST